MEKKIRATMKMCSKCGIEKDISEFKKYTYTNKRTKEKIISTLGQCKSCMKKLHENFRRKRGIKKRVIRNVNNCPDILPCTHCKQDKPKSDFRIRIDRREAPKREHYNSTCMKCDSEITMENYRKNKDNPDFKEKNRQRAKDYANKNPEKIRKYRSTQGYKKLHRESESKRYSTNRERINEVAKLKRQTERYKKMMADYRKKNKDKIYQQEVITKKRYHEKNRDDITDKYCSHLLRAQGVEITEESIELKRIQILQKRIQIFIQKK